MLSWKKVWKVVKKTQFSVPVARSHKTALCAWVLALPTYLNQINTEWYEVIHGMLTLWRSHTNMEKPWRVTLTTLLFLVIIEHVELSKHNKTLLLSPPDLQEIFRDIEKLWTPEANDALPPDSIHGIQLRPSNASIGLVGQKTKIKVIPDESYSTNLDRKLIVSSGNRRIFRVLTKEIILPGTVGNRSDGLFGLVKDKTELSIILLGLKPGRTQLHVQVKYG